MPIASSSNVARSTRDIVGAGWQAYEMAAAAHGEIRDSARLLDRALQVVEDMTHSLRQKLLARELSRSLPPEHWTPLASNESGLSADDLRRRASEVRHDQRG